VVYEPLAKLQKEGELGRKKITQWTRYLTVLLAALQSFVIAFNLQGASTGVQLVVNPGTKFVLMTMLTLTAGSTFIMWLGEQITERGIGNGISLVIFAGIITGIPSAAVRMVEKAKMGDITAFDLAVIGILIVLVVGVIIFFERGQRRIPVQYAKRIVGQKIYGGQSTHLPLKVNTAGVIPPIFASSILMFPQQIASFVQTPWMQRISEALRPGDWRYNTVYVALIVFFCYFYTAVTFNPVDVADNMKKYGGFIPGIRPGKATAAYIDKVLTRITFGGAIYISVICVLPSLLHEQMKVPFYFGGTGLMIVVGVALDTVQQIESHLITRNYEGFTGPRGPRIRGRGSRGASGAVGSR
jgi:preprotein translocase subunit SecY